ncbi:MAG TPA: metallophosphoesterase family protein [Elusimicrobiales bacterium]|nr:metallophosphoesterase family protein [Elusimicrobiales bacterium]
MIYGVFSDVHGNYEALKSVLDFFSRRKVDGYLCCGDLVGYGPQPEECVQAVSNLSNLRCVIGNHDLAVLGRIPLKWFNAYATAAIEYSRGKLSGASFKFLESLPERIEEGGWTLVHGSPKNPTEEYLLTGEQFLESLPFLNTPLCFIGHSHLTFYLSRTGVRFPELIPLHSDELLRLEPELKYAVNPGSVGQPRDRDPRASCGLYDSNSGVFSLVRLEYPRAKTQELMRRSELPELLIERIGIGW